ncbi:MAG: hypothetical protein ABJB11_17695 [Ferruginibacter sp.]
MKKIVIEINDCPGNGINSSIVASPSYTLSATLTNDKMYKSATQMKMNNELKPGQKIKN